MKTRSYFLGKVFCLFLLAVLALCICTPVLAASSTTTLTTTVPACVDVGIKIVGKGTIELNEKMMSETGVVQVERNKEVFIIITPDDGYHIGSVVYDGVDITQEIKAGCRTFLRLERETLISVKFAVDPGIPNTGDGVYPSLIFVGITAGVSLLGIAVLLVLNRKNTSMGTLQF